MLAKNLGGLDNLVLRRHTSLDNARGQEEALDLSGAMKCIKNCAPVLLDAPSAVSWLRLARNGQ